MKLDIQPAKEFVDENPKPKLTYDCPKFRELVRHYNYESVAISAINLVLNVGEVEYATAVQDISQKITETKRNADKVAIADLFLTLSRHNQSMYYNGIRDFCVVYLHTIKLNIENGETKCN